MKIQSKMIIGYVVFIVAAWPFRKLIRSHLLRNYPAYLGLCAGLLLLVVCIPWLISHQKRVIWKTLQQRLNRMIGLGIRGKKTPGKRIWMEKVNCWIEGIFAIWPLSSLMNSWRDAGLGNQPLALLPVFLGIPLVGYAVGFLSTRRTLLSWFVVALFWIGLLAAVSIRARLNRRQFNDQLPDVLDRLADAMQAGFSFVQAVEYVAPNLPSPSSEEMKNVRQQIQLGYSVQQSLQNLYHRRPSADVRILVEGVSLQHKVGGNLAAMMRDLGHLIRERVELKKDIYSKTAQGRLSAMVIALLVPISLGLLSFFPGYTDVLFHTNIGNLVVVTAGLLEILGGLLIIKLIRIEV